MIKSGRTRGEGRSVPGVKALGSCKPSLAELLRENAAGQERLRREVIWLPDDAAACRLWPGELAPKVMDLWDKGLWLAQECVGLEQLFDFREPGAPVPPLD